MREYKSSALLVAVTCLWSFAACTTAKPPATGPLRVKAVLLADGQPIGPPENLHLVTVHRDAKGDITQATEEYGAIQVSSLSERQGAVSIEVPRKLVAGGGEFSFATNRPGSLPRLLRRGDAVVYFKVDPATEEIDLGEVIVR
jgi:hypothetical protein